MPRIEVKLGWHDLVAKLELVGKHAVFYRVPPNSEVLIVRVDDV